MDLSLLQFSAKAARVEEHTFDDVKKTKMALKEARRGRFGGFSNFFGAAANDSDDDSSTSCKRAAVTGVVDPASSDDEVEHAGNVAAGCGPRRSSRRWGAYATAGVAIDLRNAADGVPDGLEVIGGEGVFEEQEDGGVALLVPEGAYVKLTIPGMSPWQLEEDGRLHRYSLLMAIRLDRLPYVAHAPSNTRAHTRAPNGVLPRIL